MNYRDFFKNHKATAEDIRKLMPEGVDPDEFRSGINHEKEHTDDEFMAAKIAGDHLDKKKGGDPKYYTKLDAAGLEEEEQDEHCGACKDDMGGEEYPHDDFNGGLPKLGGALAVPHLGDPIRMAKIIQVGGEFKSGQPASGEQSGMSACGGKGVTKDTGGVKADAPGDKEPITAGGKKADSSIASKTVGGPVSSGEGQKQGGPNSQGTIASTPKLNEHKEKVRSIVKEVLKEIRFDKASGKWVRIDEAKHKAGCTCGFCKNKGTFGKKKAEKPEKEDKEEVDETVDMKMGPSYKKVQPRMYKVADDDFARTNQYDPEISEMIDEEEIQKMHERYAALITAPKNLSEAELAEMKSLREKISRNFGASNGGVEPNLYDEGRCEDFPCCGHEPGDCPDSEGRFTCVGCGKRLPRNAPSSLCPKCQSRMSSGEFDDRGEYDAEDRYGTLYHEKVNEKADAAMKMGASYRVVAPRQARVADDDQAHRNQDTPDSTNEAAGGMSVQHRSYRTIDDAPQNPKARTDDEVCEGEKKVSKVVKTIKKGQKPKTNKPKNFKHEVPRHTTSGVHKRKS